ncbi:nitrous oxide-stimulated promoter family protein [Bacteroides sp. OttesenSCG-928-J23]|nr:nitrous oxide-stimulated promoter family protein [Bacteroides sp. OttesenSCG-928-J23]
METMRKESVIRQEKRTIELMIRLYCRKKEKNPELCATCRELLEYALARLDRCPFGEKKKACKHCSVHCYKPKMRERVREVMRYSGPRMLFYAPKAAMLHLLHNFLS